jgi:bacillithiol biosynthesis cysteine-adding enzyme BshC
LFGQYGLLVFLPDQAACKLAFTPIIQQELEDQFSHACVKETVQSMPEKYQTAPTGRELNLFYLKDGLRERIIKTEDGYRINQTDIHFAKDAIMDELYQHPERFSPNVVLRPLYQEMLLPNVAFVGGGSELSYWMQLKNVFEKVNIPYPPLILRNSFLVLNEESFKLMKQFGFTPMDFFFNEHQLIKEWLKNKSGLSLSLEHEIQQMEKSYAGILQKAKNADVTLEKHLLALQHKATENLHQLEQKMLRAEKRKHEVVLRCIQKIKAQTHPENTLQERTDTLLNWYARLGISLIDEVYLHSMAINQEFCVLEINR